jgi:hypothetical protein
MCNGVSGFNRSARTSPDPGKSGKAAEFFDSSKPYLAQAFFLQAPHDCRGALWVLVCCVAHAHNFKRLAVRLNRTLTAIPIIQGDTSCWLSHATLCHLSGLPSIQT